ncbi:hypothetical protein OQA88_7722 [Cercophora sp. LCS_1]
MSSAQSLSTPPSEEASSSAAADLAVLGEHEHDAVENTKLDQTALQRVENVATTPDTARLILDAGFLSAAQIASTSSAAFAAAVPELPLTEAEQIHRNAIQVNNRNQMALAAAAPSLASEVAPLAAAVTSPTAGAVNLDTLFANSVTTKCENATSVLGPSAYLVDLLEFLPKTNTVSVREKLLERRPDIANIELSGPNTNTEIPYIDLVNEVLESYLGSTAGKETPSITAYNDDEDSLPHTEPVNVNALAYDMLLKEISPVGILPFDRNLEQSRVLLEKLGSSRQTVMEVFGAPAAPTLARAKTAEALGLPEREYTVLTGQGFDPTAPIQPVATHDCWGFETQSDMLDVRTGIARVHTQFLPRAGYTYDDLVELLRTNFVNGGIPKVLLDDQESLEKLWKRVNWTVEDDTNTKAKWGQLLLYLGISLDSNEARDIIMKFNKLPNLVVITPMEDGATPFTESKSWPLAGTLYYAKEGDVPESSIYGAIDSQGQITFQPGLEFGSAESPRLESKAARPRIGFVDDRGIFRTLAPSEDGTGATEEDKKHPPLYSLPWYQDADKFFWVKAPGQGSPVVGKLLRDDANPRTNGEMLVVNPYFKYMTLGPRSASPIAGWSCDPLPTRGEPKPRLLTLRTLSGQPLPVAQWSRINTFVRLQKRMGWSISETDQLLTALNVTAGSAAAITPSALDQIVLIKKLQAATGLHLSQALVLAADMGIAYYISLFVKPSVLRSDRLFGLSRTGVPVFVTKFKSKPKVMEHCDAIGSVYGVSPAALARLLVALCAQDETLTMRSLSRIYRYTTVCKALGQPLQQMPSMLRVYGQDPMDFNPDNPAINGAQGVLEFVRFWKLLLERYRRSPGEWDYVVTGTDVLSRLEPPTKTVVQAAASLRKAVTVAAEDKANGRSVASILVEVLGGRSLPLDALSLLLRDESFDFLRPDTAAGGGTYGGLFTPPSTGLYILQGQEEVKLPQGEAAQEDAHPLLDMPIRLDEKTDLVGGQVYLLPSTVSHTSLTMSVSSAPSSPLGPPMPVPEGCLCAMDTFLGVKQIVNTLTRCQLLLDMLNITSAADIECLIGLFRRPLWPHAMSVEELKCLVTYDTFRARCVSSRALATLLRHASFPTSRVTASYIREATGWNLELVQDLVENMEGCRNSDGVFKLNLGVLDRLRVAYDVLVSLGVSSSSMPRAWARPDARMEEVSGQLRALVRSKVDEKAWEDTAAALFNPIRHASRNALVAGCINVLPQLRDADDLFEHFLIDVSMGTCLQTSRLKQAISSVQIFVRRCLLGLETANGIAPSAIDKRDWAWMESYDTWRANREVLLYPENWLEPSLRDDKSAVFTAVEGLLSQGGLSTSSAIAAYVSGLQEVADLEPVAVKGGPERDHVFARARTAPHKVFYRTYTRNTGCWSPWEPVQVDIPTITLQRTVQTTPGFFEHAKKIGEAWPTKADLDRFMTDNPNRSVCTGTYMRPVAVGDNDDRIAIFMPTLTQKSYAIPHDQERSEDAGKGRMRYYWELGMAFSERKEGGRWTPRQFAPETVLVRPAEAEPTSARDEVLQLPLPRLADTDLDKHLIREGMFWVLDTVDERGATALYVYVLVPTVPKVRRGPNETQLCACAVGEFVFEGGELHVRRVRSSDEWDVVVCHSRWAEDWVFQGRTKVEGGSRTRVLSSMRTLTDDGVTNMVSVDVAPVAAGRTPRIDGEAETAHALRQLWAKSVVVRPTLDVNKTTPLSVPLSNNLAGTFHDLVTRGQPPRAIFDYIGNEKALWPIAVAPLFPPSNERTTFDGLPATTVLDQDLGIQDRRLPNLWYHELRTPNALYNWELCVHLPMLLATAFLAARQHDEALDAVRLVFDPTADTSTDAFQVWRFLPFRETARAGTLEAAAPSQFDMAELRHNPFNPFAVARQRTTAFMKWFAYKYVELMLEKGDVYFRRFTLESITLAIQCYVEAAHVYGPRAQEVMSVGKKKVQTFNSVAGKGGWAAQSTGRNVLVNMETLFPFRMQAAAVSNVGTPVVNIFGTSTGDYFGVPGNHILANLRARIDDRLSKIRHCQDIDGHVRSLALWEPPLDPGALVRAYAAAGGATPGSITDSVSVLKTPPNCRFTRLHQLAVAQGEKVKTLGLTILRLRRRKDAAELALLRAEQARETTRYMRDLAALEIDEADKELEVIRGNREAAEERMRFFLQLLGLDKELVPKEGDDSGFTEIPYGIADRVSRGGLQLSPSENDSFVDSILAVTTEHVAGTALTVSAIFKAMPEVEEEAAPLGVGFRFGHGPQNVAGYIKAVAEGVHTVAETLKWKAEDGRWWAELERLGWERTLEANECGQTIVGLDAQANVVRARREQARTRLALREAQAEQREAMERAMRRKYTCVELYTWTLNGLQALYHDAYGLALDLAGQAEAAFCFERGLVMEHRFIHGGYWDASHDGLLAGEHLGAALARLEAANVASRANDYDISRDVSLRQVAPLALVRLRSTGDSGVFELPEVLWDMDFPGHFNRRIKSVRVSILLCDDSEVESCTPVNATLELRKQRARVDGKTVAGYGERDEPEERFVTTAVPVEAIAVSRARAEDAGVFRLGFDGERYMPFEGAGLISSWCLKLNSAVPPFEYGKIRDVVLHVQYTSMAGSEALGNAARRSVVAFLEGRQDSSGLGMLFDARADGTAERWGALLKEGVLRVDGKNLRRGLPFYARSGKAVVSVQRVCVIVEWMGGGGGGGEEEERLKMRLRVGKGEGVSFEVVGRRGDRGAVIGSDERGAEALEVLWKAGREEDEWVLEVDGGGGKEGRVVGGISGLWVVLGYSLKL